MPFLLAQHNHVTAVDIVPEKVEKINAKISPIQDDYIEKYLAEKPLNLKATTDGAAAYKMRIWSSSLHRPTTTARKTFLIHQLWKLSSNLS